MGLSPVDTPSRLLAANSILRPGKNLPGVRWLPMMLAVTASRWKYLLRHPANTECLGLASRQALGTQIMTQTRCLQGV